MPKKVKILKEISSKKKEIKKVKGKEDKSLEEEIQETEVQDFQQFVTTGKILSPVLKREVEDIEEISVSSTSERRTDPTPSTGTSYTPRSQTQEQGPEYTPSTTGFTATMRELSPRTSTGIFHAAEERGRIRRSTGEIEMNEQEKYKIEKKEPQQKRRKYPWEV